MATGGLQDLSDKWAMYPIETVGPCMIQYQAELPCARADLPEHLARRQLMPEAHLAVCCCTAAAEHCIVALGHAIHSVPPPAMLTHLRK